MAGTSIKILNLAILKKGHENFVVSSSSALPSLNLDLNKMEHLVYGYYNPWTDSALNEPSAANDFIQPTGAAPVGAYLAVEFMYKHTNNYTERYLASATSTAIETAINSANNLESVNAANSFTKYPST